MDGSNTASASDSFLDRAILREVIRSLEKYSDLCQQKLPVETKFRSIL